MESPIKTYKRLVNINNIKQIAYDTLFTKYIIENLKEEDKMLEIDSTNQEGLMMRFNGGFPIPGFIYTYIYPPTKGDETIIKDGKKTKKYNDYVPIIFCTSVQGKIFKGINLNALPNIERVKFLETYYRVYIDFFKDVELLTENNRLALNNKYINLALSSTGFDVIKLFNEITQSNFNYGFRSYSMDKIKQLRMIEYTEWDYIPHYDPKDAFKLMSQKQIHELYYRTL